MASHLKTLITKLHPLTRAAAERAASLSLGRGHHEVDVEHLFLALLEQPNNDLQLLCRRCDVDADALRRDLENALAQLRDGNTRTPVFSPRLPVLLEHSWLLASLENPAGRIRSGHLLLALLTEPTLAQFAQRDSHWFAHFPVHDIKHDLPGWTAGSPEAEGPSSAAQQARAPAMHDEVSGDAGQGTPALDQFTTPLTRHAREGRLDPVIGRDAEIRQAIDILMRRRQNNPILTGDAGVGKTAVVEGLALRIAAGDVPPPLASVELHVLDLALLQAGASVKGEFERRLKQVIDEVKASPHPVVLFIDEAHTLIGAGGSAGQNDAANLLKPALARGELRTIAATTWSEYKKYFEKDAALARRFQVVKVEEPSEALAAAMVRGMAPRMEHHFQVRILDEAITEAVRLSARYISGRQMPDKCISVLDTACARVALAQAARPAALEALERRIERVDAEVASLERETATGRVHAARLSELRAERAADAHALEGLRQRHAAETVLVDRIRAQEADADAQPGEEASAELRRLRDELVALQADAPLVPLQVDGQVVAEVVAAWTGVPLGKMVKDDLRTVLRLPQLLGERVLGQSHAIHTVAQRVRTSRAQLEDPDKPKGVFLFVGPSGVGKTETALALADALYGGERKLITLNMSEYQEAHAVSGLKGSPPGYVGYGEGGVLTEAVRRQPHSVVLLDEVEKAHPDVLELFYQVFDKGVMEDAEGREIDFRQCLIILTSNVGSAQIMQACLSRSDGQPPTAEALLDAVRPALYKAFRPAFLGRLKVVPFHAISDPVLEDIIRMKLARIAARVKAHHGAAFEHDRRLVQAVLARCTEVDTGARNVDHILNGSLLPEIAEQVLARLAQGQALQRIKVSAAKNGDFRYAVA